jgi:membrane-bound serine protease (ClpP class)
MAVEVASMNLPALPRCHTSRRTLRIVTLVALLVSFALAARGQIVGGPPAGAGEPIIKQPSDRAALIKLSGPVDDVMLSSLKRRVDLARKANCTLLILELDTNGGLLTSALDISRYIKQLDLPTVAWVNSKAYSAGAIIALACRQRVMAPSAQMGDAMPIQVSFDQARAIPDDLKAKARSPLLAELADSAAKNGFDERLAWAMVVPEMTVYELRNVVAGEKRFVADGAARDRLLAEEGPPNAEGKRARPWRLSEPVVDGPQTLLTVDTDQAIAMGLAQREVGSPEQLRAVCNVRGELLELDYSWSELFVRWLTQWHIRFALFVIMLVLGYIELLHPGISLPGLGAVVCLLLLVGAPYLTGLAQVWEILLIVAGLAVIVADLFFLGTLGMLAVPGFILLAVGLIASFVPMGGGWGSAASRDGLLHGTTVLVVGSLASLGIFFVLSRFLYLTPGFRRLQLAPTVRAAQGPVVYDANETPAGDVVFVGALGKAASDLRPAGKARFDEHLIDVVTEGQFVPAGETVVVMEIEGVRVVVRPHTSPARAEGAA